jgi:hypothetical protein
VELLQEVDEHMQQAGFLEDLFVLDIKVDELGDGLKD